MGKLHKLRKLYQKSDKEVKESLASYFSSGWQKNGPAYIKAKELANFLGKHEYDKPYRYHLESLLKKDGFLKPNKKWTKRVSVLHSFRDNTYHYGG